MSSRSSHSASARSELTKSYGHEFQAKFHWNVEDLGIGHAYIKRGTPQLNGKVERSHRSDGQEFCQLLRYRGDVDLEAKLSEWERFYNFHRPHGAHNGKTPYEALREKLSSTNRMSLEQPHLTGRVALDNAVSVASLLLLTEATMTDLPEPEKPSVPQPYDMGV